MRFQTPLVPGRLIRRYKRFLADVRLDSGAEVTVHCPNPGAMLGLADPGVKIWLEPNDDPRRKLRYGWRLVDHENGHFTCVDTMVANRVVGAALRAGAVPGLLGYDSVRAEVKFGTRSRVDFVLSTPGQPDTWVEVKSVTLRGADGWAEFPDTVTARGTRHLAELTAMRARGQRAVMFYLVQRTDCTRFRLAPRLDPAYASAYDDARAAGVEVLCHTARITPEGVRLGPPIGVDSGLQAAVGSGHRRDK